ncbi:MAG: methionine synthase [Clostridiaceae bacterium]
MDIDKKEVLRYLGYKNNSADKQTSDLIDECIDEMMKISKPKYIYKIFDIKKEQEQVNLLNTTLSLKGKNIKNHLKFSSKCSVMAATLGIEADRQISIYSNLNLSKALVMDSCATAAIESLCDMAQEEIKEYAKTLGFNITGRFSPGYGDLSIEIQPEIINILDAYKKIGLTATESCILIPRKSVTAFIGFQKPKNCDVKPNCLSCNKNNCEYRRSDYISE